MKHGADAWIQMRKQLKKGQEIDNRIYLCKVWRYDEKKETIYLSLQEGRLSQISLDAVYECKIQGEEDGLLCVGRVHERYQGEGQQMMEFEIENGFYKICLN